MRNISKVKKITVLSITGALAISWCITSVSAGMVATEKPLAGINLSLDKLVVADVQTGAILPLSGSQSQAGVQPAAAVPDAGAPGTDGMAAAPGTDGTAADSAQPADAAAPVVDDVDAAEEIDEHVKLNLNYDRLGIAKVDTYLNVRKKPSTDSKIVGKLIKNAGCHIYKVKKGWAKIVSGKVTGYVKAEYLVMDKKAEEMAMKVGTKVATILTSGLRVRALPSTDAAIYDVLGQDEDFEVHREHIKKEWLDKFIEKHIKKKQIKRVDYDAMINDLDNWVCIAIDNEYAFVSKEYVEISYKLNRAVAAGEIATDGSDGVSSIRASIVEYAKQFLGNRYVYGGTSLTNGTDCSGFTMRVYQHFGYGLPRTSGSQAAAYTGIKSSEARPGDLFFYANGGRINHVAMYIGSGMIIHASNPRTGIKISNAYYRSPAKIARVIND